MYIFVVLGQATQDSSRAAWAWIGQIALDPVKPDQGTLGVTPGQAQVQRAYGAPWVHLPPHWLKTNGKVQFVLQCLWLWTAPKGPSQGQLDELRAGSGAPLG